MSLGISKHIILTLSTLYQIENLGDDDEEQIEYSSSDMDEDHASIPLFSPRPLRNIVPVDEMESLAPIMDAKVQNLTNEETPQVHVLCGQGARSTFRILKHGLEISEMAVSELPGNPNAVWTVKASAEGILFSITLKIHTMHLLLFLSLMQPWFYQSVIP